MTRSLHLALSALLLCGPASGCVFNPPSLVPGDGSGRESGADLPPVPDVGRDAAETGVDTQPDAISDLPEADWSGDPECKDYLGSFVCRFETTSDTLDTVGQSGYCSGSQFVRLRYCFDDAPCLTTTGAALRGLCVPNAGCQKCACTASSCVQSCPKTCTALPYFEYGLLQLQSCCAGTSLNGTGTAIDACTQHSDCSTGLCTNQGICFQPCTSMGPFPCPLGRTCAKTSVTLKTNVILVTGCIKATSTDASPDLIPVPDAQVPDV